jgi:parvulin-like peptidyl-prolyl isomerase
LSRLQSLFRTGEIDPESRNRFLLIAGLAAVVVLALAVIAVGYYVDRIAPRGETVFIAGDREFSYAYLEDRINATAAEGRFDIQNPAQSIAITISDIQNEELTRLIAAEDGVTISDEELDLGIRDDVGVQPETSRNAYANALRDRLKLLGLSMGRYEEMIEADLLQEKITNQYAAALPTELEQVELSLLLVDTDAAAATARQRIVDGEDFGEVATEVSQDSSASTGGALGWTPRDLLLDDLAEAVFAVEPDTLSDVIETDRGFYVVRVDGKETRAVDEVMASNLARTYFADRLEAASNQYALENLLTVGQAQRLVGQIEVPGG